MKKIVFVIESLQLGGAEKSLVTLLKYLDYDNYSIDLITFQSNGFFNDFVPKEVNKIIIPFPKISIIDRLEYALSRKFVKDKHPAQLFWPIVSRYFDTYSKTYDIAIAYNQGFATYFVNNFIIASKKISWLNTDYEKAGYNINFDIKYYKNFQKIIAVSPDAKLSLEGKLSKYDHGIQIDIIKDICDKNFIIQQSEKLLANKFNQKYVNIVTVCRLSKHKGLNLAINAAKILTEKSYQIRWFIVGEGKERKSLEKLIKYNSLQNIVILTGATTNPYPYMKAADIYVQTSLFEGLGLTVIEAAMLNKPIVCTNFPTVFGILKDQETGLICKMNAVSIAESIEKLIVNKDLKNKFITNLSMKENKDMEVSLSLINKLLQE